MTARFDGPKQIDLKQITVRLVYTIQEGKESSSIRENQSHGRFNNLLQEHQSDPNNAIAEETK